MKRSLILFLTVVVLAGWLGTLIARDPGYVLLAYDGFSFQTSLWVLLAMLLLMTVAVYYVVRLTRLFPMGPGAIREWRGDRRSQRAHQLTRKGLALLSAGEYARAEKFLISGAESGDDPGTNFLAAARAADAQDKGEQREALLRLAVESDGGLASAASVSAAEMAAAKGDWQRCLLSLGQVKPNALVLRLQQKALFELGDWRGLADLMPVLRRSGADVSDMEKRVALGRLSAPGNTDSGRTAIYRKLKDDLRRDTEVILSYVEQSQDEKAAEAILRREIKRQWQPQLVLAYGRLGAETLVRRIKHAEAWRKKQPGAELHLALATMYECSGDNVRARQACQESIELGPLPEANALMASLLAADGDYAGSNEHLQRAMAR